MKIDVKVATGVYAVRAPGGRRSCVWLANTLVRPCARSVVQANGRPSGVAERRAYPAPGMVHE